MANSAPTDSLRACCPFARSRWASGADPAQQARERDGRPGPVKLSRLGRVAQARLDAARESPCCGVARLPPLLCPSRDANHTSRRIQRVDDPEMMLTGVTMRVAIKQVCYSLHAIGAEVSLVDSWLLCRYIILRTRGDNISKYPRQSQRSLMIDPGRQPLIASPWIVRFRFRQWSQPRNRHIERNSDFASHSRWDEILLPGTVACMIPPHTRNNPGPKRCERRLLLQSRSCCCGVWLRRYSAYFSLTRRRPRAGLAYPYPVPSVCAERARRRGGGGGIGACRWRRVKCSCRPPRLSPAASDPSGAMRLAPISTLLDLGCCFPPPQPRSLIRTQKQRGAPVRTGEVLRPLWAGLEVGSMGGITGWGRLMRLETSFLMRRLLVACCRSVFG